VLLQKLLKNVGNESHRLLWNWKLHCYVHNSLPLASILRQFYQVHKFQTCFFKTVLIKFFRLGLTDLLPTCICIYIYMSTTVMWACFNYSMHATLPPNLSLTNLITITVFRATHVSPSTSFCIVMSCKACRAAAPCC
jgi:hypothetical protein